MKIEQYIEGAGIVKLTLDLLLVVAILASAPLWLFMAGLFRGADIATERMKQWL